MIGLLAAFLVLATAERTAQFLNQEKAGFANFKINTVDKVKVEAISRAEAIRLRQSGLKFHEVEHHHFSHRSAQNGKLWKELTDAAAWPWKKKKGASGAAKKEEKVTKEEEEEATDSNSSLDTSLQEILAPQKQIKPTRVGGFLCAQFDLDLLALSGGTFPGLFGVGLLGDIHYQPSSRCFGWTAELYLMLSIGIGLLGMDFRISLVIIATLVVTERPLAAGDKDLVWELPPGFDTKHCTEKNPFKLIQRTTKEGWGFIYNNILRRKYLKHAEVQVNKYLKEHEDEFTAFQSYMDFIEPPQPMVTMNSESQSRGLATEGLAMVKISGQWLEDELELHVSFPDASSLLGAWGAWHVRARTWQELEQMFISQESARCYPKGPSEDQSCVFRFPDRRWHHSSKAFAQIILRSSQVYVVPIQLDREDEHFAFEAPLRAEIAPSAATLSCQRLTVRTTPGCEELKEVKLQVKVGEVEEEATWSFEQLGEGSPWGIDVTDQQFQSDESEIDEALVQQKGTLSTLRVYELRNDAVLRFIDSFRAGRPEWCRQDSERQELWELFESPSQEAALKLEWKTLAAVWNKMLLALQDDLRSQMEAHESDTLLPMDLSKKVKVPEELRKFIADLVRRFDTSVAECAKMAVLQASDKEKTLLQGLKTCSRDDATGSALRHLRQLYFSKPAGKLKWMDFPKRTANIRSCSSEGLVSADSVSNCRLACDRAESCNAVVYEPEGQDAGWCTLWACSDWDDFPHDDSKLLSIQMAEQWSYEPSEVDIFLSATGAELWEAIRQSPRADLEAVDVKLDAMKEAWRTELRGLWPTSRSWPLSARDFFLEGFYQPLLARCILKDYTHLHPFRVREFTQGSSSGENGVGVTLNFAGKKNTLETQFGRINFINDFRGGSNRWVQSSQLSSTGCKAEVTTSWIWQVPLKTAYFLRPNMVPVAQALFAAYDQFVSKLPAYSAQVANRIEGKESSKWKLSVLPYKSTDGRHLHRHLKKGERDRLKIYKGDLATDDAVYNFPRAMEESSHRDEPAFLYNVGLSVANLFLRVLSDIQALFNLYFANHPDWDQTCRSLPARFNLPFEMGQTRLTSNWRSNLRFSKGKEGVKLTHRAGTTVSEQGAEFSADDKAMIENWHWVSKPFWIYKSSGRAEFLKQTPPVHGKDGWATTDVSELEATMWPHIWCELAEQEWVSLSTELPSEESTDSGDVELLENLEELYSGSIPDIVAPVLEHNGFVKAAATVVRMLSDFPKTGCPTTMKEKQEKSVARTSFGLLSTWDSATGVVTKCLTFLQTLTEMLIDSEEQKIKAEGGQLGGVEKAEAGEVSRTAELDTIMDTIQVSMEKWRTEGVLGQALRNSLTSSWSSLFKNLTQAEENSAVEERRSFQQSYETLESLLLAERARTREIGDHLERLFASATDRGKEEGGMHPMHAALRYVGVLAEGALVRQKEVLGHFRRVATCIDVLTKPKALPKEVLGRWTNEEDGHTLHIGLKDVRHALQRIQGSALEFFFEEACRVPDEQLGKPDSDRRLELDEARPECERVVLSKAFMVIFPTFARDAAMKYGNLGLDLKYLAREPSKERLARMLLNLNQFVRSLANGGKTFLMDMDFYKAFAYHKDGQLIGNLWSNLPSSLREIAATLQTRKDTRTQWITESIAYRSKLKTAKRKRVREQETSKKVIVTRVEGCVCQERWSTYVRKKYGLPRLVSYTGCKKNSAGVAQRLSRKKAAEGWKGICKTKEDSRSINQASCKTRWAECDPEAVVEAPKYQIWRAADVMRTEPVRLPLLQLDFYLHVDLRNRRADFCTPNFAALMLDTNWHWSMSSWLPYDLRRSACVGGRIHPPGVSLQLTVCRHRALGGLEKQHVTTEWSLTGVAYLISHYNVWGTGDGDMAHNWFGGSENWGAKMGSLGWPNFVMADPGTWASSSAGSGYLSTSNVVASQSAFWFSLCAELASFMTLPKMSNSTNATAMRMLEMGVYSVWRIFQQYGVVPTSWSPFVSNHAVLKSLSSLGATQLTPFRNEHDVILSIKSSAQWSQRKMTLLQLIDDLSMDQLRLIFLQAKSYSADIDSLWRSHSSSSTARSVRNLNRKMLERMMRGYMAKARKNGSFLSHATSKKLVQNLFRRCPGRPLWYQVSQTRQPLYTFWKRERSAWVAPKLEPGHVLMITKYDDDWYSVVDTDDEEDRYIPAQYLSSHMKLVEDVLSIRSKNNAYQVKNHQLEPEEMEMLNLKASVETLECWGMHISSVMPDQQEELIKEANRREKDRSPSMLDVKEGSQDEVPFDYFSLDFVRSFMREHFEQILQSIGKDEKVSLKSRLWHTLTRQPGLKPSQAAFLQVFNRGQRSRVRLKPGKLEEITTSRSSYTDLGLSVLTRLGLPFIKLPGVFQVQPYIQLSVQYDVKEIFRAFKAKLKGRNAAHSNQVQQYLKRKAACEQCVERNLGFCDRQEAAVAMNRKGLLPAMDSCEVKSDRLKEMCVNFEFTKSDMFYWGLSHKGFAGPSIFEKQMCPCYTAVSGTPVAPRWITRKESCADLSWPDDEVEALKRASKDRDWQSGFSITGNSRLKLGQVNAGMPPPVDCTMGHRCCGLYDKKKKRFSKVRCVEIDSLSQRSRWMSRKLGGGSKCKNFDASGGKWTHAAGRCKEEVLDGTWRWNAPKKSWEMYDPLKALEEEPEVPEEQLELEEEVEAEL